MILFAEYVEPYFVSNTKIRLSGFCLASLITNMTFLCFKSLFFLGSAIKMQSLSECLTVSHKATYLSAKPWNLYLSSVFFYHNVVSHWLICGSGKDYLISPWVVHKRLWYLIGPKVLDRFLLALKCHFHLCLCFW